MLKIQKVGRLEIIVVRFAALSTLLGTLIPLATTLLVLTALLVLTTLATLALARLALASALDAAALPGRFTALLPILSLLTLSLLTLGATCGSRALGLLFTLSLLLISIS